MMFQPGKGGIAPPEWQCTAIRWRGERCKRWRAKGDPRFCPFHAKLNVNTGAELPMIYRRYLKSQLAKSLDEFIREGNATVLDLCDELAMFRELAGRSIETYGAALEASEKDPTNEKKKELVEIAAQLMKDNLREVISVCESATRVATSQKAAIPANFMSTFVLQVVQVAHRAFGEDDARVEEFGRLLRTEIKVPGEAEGTSVTPDQDVALMDETVPR
jgi:hypothetical protein